MDVKGKGRFNLEPFHKRKTGTVCKRKVLIIVFTKYLPGSLPVNKSYRFYCEEDIGFKRISEFGCTFTTYGPGKEIKCFYKNQIGCEEIASLNNEIGIELSGYLCILVIFIGYSDPCTGIDKYPHFWVLVKGFLP